MTTEFTAYESALSPTPASSPEVEVKTNKPSANPNNDSKANANLTQKYLRPIESNVLNGYRSITYNFTLAGLPSEYVSDPEVYRKAELGLVILKSGGKGLNTIMNIKNLTSAQVAAVEEPVLDKYSAQNNQRKVKEKLSSNQEIINGFNERSPGRFDMFLDDVEIENLMTFTEESNVTLPTKIKFTVVEPYSVNGFIEALHVASVAAGYTSYVNASFVLKVEFWGIPDSDNEEFKIPEKIPNADRYFPLGLTGVDVDITEKGTRYQCSAVPYNERAFGNPSVVKKPIKMQGTKVQDILTNFMKAFNEQLVKANEDSKLNAKNVDVYNIKFVNWSSTDGWVDAAGSSDIGKSDVLDLYEDNVLYGFAKPNDGKNAYKPGTEPKSIKYNPNSAAINFPENISIHEVISAVIRDSTYVRNILKDLANKEKARSRIDDLGRVNYFSIKLEVKNRDVYDEISKKPFQEFTFVVSPYKAHFTKIPRYGQVQIKEEEFLKLCLREYNYFYMGQNIDVLNFKLNFNTLYFEAVPIAMADQNVPNYRDSAKPDNRQQTKLDPPTKAEQVQANPAHPMPPVREVPVNTKPESGSAIPIQNDPYAVLSRSMHDAIINSKASMVTGEIDILGDPFYLVTGGMGSYNPKPVQGSRDGVVGLKEASPIYGEINIVINFRNPIDISPLEEGGLMKFDSNRVPFSGVYTITKVVSTFKNGDFKQRLEIIRKPGQIFNDTAKEILPSDIDKTVKNEDNVTVSTQGPEAPSLRPDSASVAEYFDRGAPNLDSNFVNAPGGLGGSDSTLERTYGLVGKDGRLVSASGVIGQALPTDSNRDIKINVNELSKMGNSSLTPAALINAAANVITGNVPFKAAASTIAGTLIGESISNVLKKSNPGSGIGQGATVSIPGLSSIPLDPTANEIKAGAIENPLSSAQNLVSNVAGTIQNIGQNALSQVNRLGSQADLLVGAVGAKIASSLGSTADPSAVAANVGVDSARLSGLSSNITGKVPKEVTDILSKTPQNVNLSQALDQGIALSAIPPSKYPNIPPTTPFKTAPFPEPDPSRIISSVNIGQIPVSSNKVDMSVARDKINTVKTQVSKFTGTTPVVDKTVSGSVGAVFGSKNSQNPLERLINKSNRSME